jgi:putative mRNA 3-end processing factor
MDKVSVQVSPSGAVLLGEDIVCDGFVHGVPVRVQTHVHDDHMKGFTESKGYQDIYMSRATRSLLQVELNADLALRQNLHGVDCGEWVTVAGHEMQLLSSSHMLGAVQVCVRLADGTRVGYSGDYGWPIEKPIQVDQLVLDSTNGSVRQTRRYIEEYADECFAELLRERLRFGAVHLAAHRGTIHRALQILATEKERPILATKRRCAEIAVFRNFGYPVPEVLDRDSPDGRAAAGSNCIYIYSKGDKKPVDYGNDTSIVLSAYIGYGESPVLKFTERSWRVAMCEHADFEGCFEYVSATNAQFVLVENTRNGNGAELAAAISEKLGVEAIASSSEPSREWGV